MCGRFAQYQGTADYLRFLNSDCEVIGGYDNAAIARYNVAPGTRVRMLRGEAQGVRVCSVRWGWEPDWAKGKLPPAINARAETVARGKFFKGIWPGRSIVFADGWYEWVAAANNPKHKQPYFISHREGAPAFFAALSQFSSDGEEGGNDGFVIITEPSRGPMREVHARQPVVLAPELARRWIDPALTSAQAEALMQTQGLSREAFIWHAVNPAVGNAKNDTPELLQAINTQLRLFTLD